MYSFVRTLKSKIIKLDLAILKHMGTGNIWVQVTTKRLTGIYSGGLAQNFPPAMVSLRGAYYLLTQKDSNVFRQKGPFFSKKGALFA